MATVKDFKKALRRVAHLASDLGIGSCMLMMHQRDGSGDCVAQLFAAEKLVEMPHHGGILRSREFVASDGHCHITVIAFENEAELRTAEPEIKIEEPVTAEVAT